MRMPCRECLCCLWICPDAYARQYLNKLDLIGFEYFGALDQMCFFLAQPKACSFELKSPTNMTLSEKLLMVSKSLSIRAVNGSQN